MRAAVAFLTPLGGAAGPSPGAVGVVSGRRRAPRPGPRRVVVVVGRAWPAAVAAALVVAADLALTGMLHFDGLLDSADGLLAHLDRGAAAVGHVHPRCRGLRAWPSAGAVLLCRWAALSSLRPAPLLLAGLWCASRTSMAAVMRTVPYARAGRRPGHRLCRAGRAPVALVVGAGARRWPWPRAGGDRRAGRGRGRCRRADWGSSCWPGASWAASPATCSGRRAWWSKQSA